MGGYWTNPITWKYLLCNVVFLNFLSPALPGVFVNNPYGPEVNGALWTMKVEVGFYVVLPFIIWLMKKTSSRMVKNLILIVIYILSFIYNAFFHVIKPKGFIAQLGHQLPAYMLFFIAGMLFVLNYDWFMQHAKIMFLPACLVLAEEWIFGLFWVKFLSPMAIMLFIAYIAFNAKLLTCIFKTDYSYIMYLVHFPLIQLMVSLGYFGNHSEVAIVLAIITAFFLAQTSECFKNAGLHKGIRLIT